MSDLISRQDAREAIEKLMEIHFDRQVVLAKARDAIVSLPSAEPKTGEWVLKGHLWECDQCGCRINRAKPLKGNIWNYHYCPNCGAKMKDGDKDDND